MPFLQPVVRAFRQGKELRLRLRILSAILVAIIGLTVAVECWPFGGPGYDRTLPQSRLLAVSFLGRTNGNAVIQVENRSSQAVDVADYVLIFSHAPDRVPDFRYVGVYTISRPKPLPAGGTFSASFPAPTNHEKWRAAVGGIGLREVSIKQALARTWIWRRYGRPLAFHTRYAQTDWIAP